MLIGISLKAHTHTHTHTHTCGFVSRFSGIPGIEEKWVCCHQLQYCDDVSAM